MKTTLVTGATGFVGWHVARALLERGDSVRALAREPVKLRELPGIAPIQGDLRDPASLQRAVEGCSVVFHVAADYRLWTREPEEMYRSNVEGTRAMLDAARRAGVERFVYTSTVGCIDVPSNGVGDEGMPARLEQMQGPYKRSKLLAEHVALEFAERGFPVVIVNPTAPVGDHDFKPTPTGKIVVDFARGAIPAYVDTGLNLVDVRDVAWGHLAACERGTAGERYILGSENMTLQQILETLAGILGRKAPRVQIPYAVAYAAGVASTAWANLTGKEPRAPLDAVRMSRKKMWVRHDKAARELGYSPGPAADALARAVAWFRDNGYC
ncbi:MAG TPA: hopanoid-associated sugar epimerase [Bryobacteraceae bacterium]|nr:hopanoid-associated sugar epimerase [Bryobacteraceae bacterium]